MAPQHVDATASREVELAISELGLLSVPPCVAVQYLAKLLPGEFSPASVTEIVECEPALAAGILSLAQRLAAGPASQRHVIRLVLERLDPDAVRQVLLQTKVTAGFEIEFAREQPALPSRTDLILHSLAVACAARRLAEAAEPPVEPNLAYSAGLLHDIGKLALQDIMPKSLATLTKEAEAAQVGLHQIEHQRLGTNHALLGKQLAQRWRLPEPVKLAIWLHHRNASVLAESVPEARLAVLVQAADHLARQADIGHSGSFDEPPALESIAASVDIAVQDLRQIRAELPAEVRRKSACLGLETPQATARYCDLIQATAARLAQTHAQRASQDRSPQTASGFLDFAQEFLRTVRADLAAVDIAEDFAQRWQRFFQTGAVCLYLTAGPRQGVVDAALVEALGHSRKTVIPAPSNGALLPQPIAGRFALLEAQDRIDWLLEQVGLDFNRDQARLVPLLSDGQAVGVLAFELNYPDDISLLAEKFERAAALAGTVLGLALAKESQEHWAERFAQADGQSQRTEDRGQKTEDGGQRTAPSSEVRPPSSETCPPVEALAEMAAGVAHELNNPLSVIAGRAQLLAQVESDGQKRHVLEVIGASARDAAGVVDDLMSYAEPALPRMTWTSISQIIEESIQLAGHKVATDHVNAQTHISPEVKDVLVDSAQVVVAVANIVANSIESYTDRLGPVKITAEPGYSGLRLRISDLGCGMDDATIRKATSPFFSAKPAGRKRGMGLAYASRLIRLNRGTLEIASQPDHGTTVTITLPYE